MGFFLTDFINSALTPPGTNARLNEDQQKSQAAGDLAGLMPAETQFLGDLQGFQQSQLPNLEAGVSNFYNQTTPSGRSALVQNYGSQQLAGATDQANGAASMFPGNPSLAQGYALNAMNQANANTAAYQAQVNSPQAEQSAWANYLSALSQASPNYSGIGQLNAGVQGQTPAYVGSGLGNFLGSALGLFAAPH